MQLDGKRILVTGGFGALGSAVVRACIAAGAEVAAIDRADAPAQPDTLTGAHLFGRIELANEDAALHAVRKAQAALEGLDGVVNIAGGFRWEKLADGHLSTWDHLWQVNLRSCAATCQAALHWLGAGSAIVNIGANAAQKASAGMGAYAASKAAVAKLTEALAEELKERDITVNAILPSIIDTAANRADMPEADFSRWVKPEQLADAIVFLLSDRARAITGALLPVVGRV